MGHIDLIYTKPERKIEIDNTDIGIWLTIRKTVKGLEDDFEDVLITVEECRKLAKILLLEAGE